jgi:hypothetical protein
MCIENYWWGNSEKEPLGRPRCRWEYNIKMSLQEIGWGSMDWIVLIRIGASGRLL